MVQMQANQHLLLQPWILAKRIGSILISGNILNMTLRVSCATVTAAASPGPVPGSLSRGLRLGLAAQGSGAAT